jgi:hypothetical protein
MKKILLITVLLFLGACSALNNLNPLNTTTNTFSTTQAATDVALIASDLAPLATAIESIAGVNAATQAQVAADLVLAQNAATQVANSTSAVGAQPYILAFETSVNAILQVAAGIKTIPEPYSSIILAVNVLLPIVETEVNTNIPTTTTTSVTKRNTFTLSETQARLILQGAATSVK